LKFARGLEAETQPLKLQHLSAYREPDSGFSRQKIITLEAHGATPLTRPFGRCHELGRAHGLRAAAAACLHGRALDGGHATAAAGHPRPLDPGAGRAPRLSHRWPDAADAAAHHRHRGGGVRLCRRLSGRASAAKAALHFAVVFHGRHDRHRDGRQPDRAVPVLGSDQRAVVPAGGLQPRRPQEPQVGAAGAGGHGQRWVGAAGRHSVARAEHGHVLHPRDHRPVALHRAHAVAHGRAAAHHLGRLHQERAVSVSLLAAGRHGGAHAGVGLPALGHHGQARRLSAGTARPRLWRLGAVAVDAADFWLIYRRLGDAAGAARARPQAHFWLGPPWPRWARW